MQLVGMSKLLIVLSIRQEYHHPMGPGYHSQPLLTPTCARTSSPPLATLPHRHRPNVRIMLCSSILAPLVFVAQFHATFHPRAPRPLLPLLLAPLLESPRQATTTTAMERSGPSARYALEREMCPWAISKYFGD
jgi:hypothetical protein